MGVTSLHLFRCLIICPLWQAKGLWQQSGRTALSYLIINDVELVKVPGLRGAQLKRCYGCRCYPL